MKIYSLGQNDIQKNGQCAVTAFLNSAHANGVITQEQYDELQNYGVLCHTSDGFIDRLRSLIGFKKEEDGYTNLIWTAHRLNRTDD
jgi:hypothetical protein